MPPSQPAARPIIPPLAIIVSRYNRTITDHLRDGAVRAYVDAGGAESSLAIIDAPGTYELPLLAMEAALQERFEGVVALGCVIRGETDHDRYISDAVSHALLQIALDTGVPVGFGVLTCNTVEQAVARSGGRDGLGADNKGVEAVRAVLAAIGGQRALRADPGSRGAAGVRFALDAPVADKSEAGPRRRTPKTSKTSRSRSAR